jgi:hypothetical protein
MRVGDTEGLDMSDFCHTVPVAGLRLLRCALLFLCREVLRLPVDLPIGSVRAHEPRRLPTVLSKEEVRRVISCTSGTQKLMAQL